MGQNGTNSNYEETIIGQQKRISKLRAELAHYSSRLDQLQQEALHKYQSAIRQASSNNGAINNGSTLQMHPSLADQYPQHANQMWCALPIGYNSEHIVGAAVSLPFPKISQGQAGNIPPKKHCEKIVDNNHRGGGFEDSKQMEYNKVQNPRYWTEREHGLFLIAAKQFGPKNYAAISQYVGTRTPKQVRTHSQKYNLKIKRMAKLKQEQAAAGTTSSHGQVAKKSEHGNCSGESANSVQHADTSTNDGSILLPHPTNSDVALSTGGGFPSCYEGGCNDFDPPIAATENLINGQNEEFRDIGDIALGFSDDRSDDM